MDKFKKQTAKQLETRIADLEADLERVRHSEQRLREIETLYKALFEYMLNGVGIYKPVDDGEDFILIDLNKAAEKIEKIKKQKVIGRNITQIFPTIKEFGLLEVFRAVMKTGKPIDHPVTRYKDDRLEGWRDHFVYRLPSGEIVTVYSDETKRKQAEEALRRSEERFRYIVESAPDCIFIKDSSLRYIYVNRAMEVLLGRRTTEIIGRTAKDLFGEESARLMNDWDLRVLKGDTVEEEHTRPVGGVPLTFHDIRVPFRDLQGEVIGVCGISRNVTDRKRTNRSESVAFRTYPSESMRSTMEKAKLAAGSDGIILLTGESGAGKDYLARWIHEHSRRAQGPFFAVNCAAISLELAESELFGHEAGAFTGARGRRRGILELAEGGSLLLNEIGELPLSMQAKLLTFLDTMSFLRVGGEKSIRVNARLIAATHRDLEAEVAEGRFLRALFYRLNVFPIEMPPLRERLEDIPILVDEIMSSLGAQMQLGVEPILDSLDVEALCRYHWPGNVRELRNVLERALILSASGLSQPLLRPAEAIHEDWHLKVRFPSDRTLNAIVDDLVESLCTEALRRSNGSRKEAARLLGISRDSIHRYIRRFRTKSENLTRP
jgi:PAS domain S-box-containing protein